MILLIMSGCATLEPPLDFSAPQLPEPEFKGVYHKVKKGETIWRIAKTYDVSINDIISTNNIPNVAQVEENQLVFIPGVYTVKEILQDVNEAQKDFIWPLKGRVLKYFRQRIGENLNKGIYIQGNRGDAVLASRTGRVVFADKLVGYGQTVILDHEDGFCTVYAMNARLFVTLGEVVPKNRMIAQVGGDSRLAYLHFEVRKNTVEDNPLYYLP